MSDKPIHACAHKIQHMTMHRQIHNAHTHTLTPPPHSCAMTYGLERTNVHAVLSAWTNERAACKRRVPVTGRMYSPLPRSGSWSSRWAGKRCCGKERWAWRRCYCYVAQHCYCSLTLAWSKQRSGQRLLTVWLLIMSFLKEETLAV